MNNATNEDIKKYLYLFEYYFNFFSLHIDSFNKYYARFHCPIDCNVVEYQTDITESRFIHNPPIGLEPVIIQRGLQNKNQNSSHILDLYKKLNTEQLDEYIE